MPKSLATAGSVKSTNRELGRVLSHPHDHRLACTPVAKFSPLTQIASTEPSSVRPACTSPSTLLTASAVSVIFTWFRVTPTSASSSATYPVTKALTVSSPPYMYQLTV